MLGRGISNCKGLGGNKRRSVMRLKYEKGEEYGEVGRIGLCRVLWFFVMVVGNYERF